MTTLAPSDVMRSLGRALDVMAILEGANAPMRLTDIARAASLHAVTTQRILHFLVDRNYVQQEGLLYSMGVVSVANAHAYLQRSSLVLAGTPVLEHVAASSGLAGTLSKRVDLTQITLVRAAGDLPLPHGPVGERIPLHLGGARVLAAGMKSEDRERLIDTVGDFTRADGKLITPRRFRAELAEIARQGYAFSKSERILGASSIAVPIHDEEGEAVGAIQLSGSAGDFDSGRQSAIVAQLIFAARDISARLG